MFSGLKVKRKLRGLEIKHKTRWILQRFFNADKECYSFLAINDTVVIGKRQIHHGADDHLAIDGDGTLLDLMHAKDAALRRIEDRRAEE